MLPRSVLARDVTEPLRLLGQVLDVIDHSTVLTTAQVPTALDALDVAAARRRHAGRLT